MSENKITKTNISFSALDPFVVDNRVLPIEKDIPGKNFILWGEDNSYPNYLHDLYNNVSTLKSIIDGCVDYICGEQIISKSIYFTDDELDDLVHDIALSYMVCGGFNLNVLRNKAGDVVKTYCLDFRNVRADKENEYYFYSEDFKDGGRYKYMSKGKCVKYPCFKENEKNVASSIFTYKNSKYNVYPVPMWAAAITSCEIERSIDEYHLNNINNNFTGSVMVSLNNGIPDDAIKEEIEKNFNEKFSGIQNAGRIVISYSDDKEHAATIEKIDTEDFSARYDALAKRSREQIYTAFRVTPNILGLPTETTGFNVQEYQGAYALFYNTVIKPIQNKIVRCLNTIFDNEIIEIIPFKVDFEETVTVQNINE